MNYPIIAKAPGHKAAITITQMVTADELKSQIAQLKTDILHDAFSIEVIGELLAQHDDDCGLNDDNKRNIGGAISRLGRSIMAAHNEIGRLEDRLQLAQCRQEVTA
ncbi:hypothetical protein GCM10022421_02400 [Oceanisphaera sediminis]|uniref:Uncharacterized protein n=1 Tax=Oceanisphaera sediminis TaxID=981381 RepID=A0ABP7D4N8_9GAMM